MARNEEKAQSMLGRYLRTARGEETKKRRPYLATLCDDVDEAEKWRLQVLRDIRRQVEEIQNLALDETKTRELNDSINKLLRERGHWERRIKFLGGTDHARRRKGQSDISDGVFEHNGYFYFGNARNLPGVHELLEREKNVARQKEDDGESAAVLSERLDAAYFGYMDDNDGVLEREEQDAEERGVTTIVKKWEEKHDGGPDDEWDNSFLKYIGKKPTTVNEENLQALLLERKKAEAIEQLELGSRRRKEAI